MKINSKTTVYELPTRFFYWLFAFFFLGAYLIVETVEEHHCTVDLRLERLGMVPFFQSLSVRAARPIN